MVSPRERARLLNSLSKMCGVLRSLPKSVITPCLENVPALATSGGGFADVYRGECRGRPVAIKVVRLYANNDNNPYLSVSVSFHAVRKKPS